MEITNGRRVNMPQYEAQFYSMVSSKDVMLPPGKRLFIQLGIFIALGCRMWAGLGRNPFTPGLKSSPERTTSSVSYPAIVKASLASYSL